MSCPTHFTPTLAAMATVPLNKNSKDSNSEITEPTISVRILEARLPRAAKDDATLPLHPMIDCHLGITSPLLRNSQHGLMSSYEDSYLISGVESTCGFLSERREPFVIELVVPTSSMTCNYSRLSSSSIASVACCSVF